MSALSLGAMPWRAAWVSPVAPWDLCDEERQEALRAAWADGEISHQLTPNQVEIYDALRAWEARPYTERGREFVLDCARRFGKSVVGLIWLIENCIRRPGSRHLYIGPERQQIETIQLPLIAHMLSECPPELRPRYHASKRQYVFPNGSRIELYGLDKNPNGSRGGQIDGAFLDECGFFRRLTYLLKSVLKMQLFGRTWGNLLLASTPPDTPAHPWSVDVVKRALARRAYVKKTIEQADQYPVEEIESFIEEAGGRADPACRREYFCEHIADAEKVCIPEYAAAAPHIVRAVETPVHRHCYTVLDPGWHDLAAVLFGYAHFELAKLVIEDELAEVRMNSAKLAALIKAKESGLWGDVKCVRSNGELTAQPYRRYSDRDPRLLGDMREIHGLSFRRAEKDTPEQAVNQLRVAISTGRIWIHPRCVQLQAHLESAVWKNEQHKAFAWQGGIFGHFDLVACLLYMWRNVNLSRNPAPQQAVVLTTDQHQAVQREREAASRWASDRQPSAWSKAAPEPRAKWTREGGRFVRTR
jgi:hypothetical protein